MIEHPLSPSVTVACPVCGLITDVSGVDGKCPVGHRFEVTYSVPESGRPIPASVHSIDPPLPPKG